MEPDRYVIVGTHRDSFQKGSYGPASSTAAMLRTVEAFSEVMENSNWRPRRTVVFVSWGASSFGQIGSTEWVEENLSKLKQRSIAYVNSDFCSPGAYLAAEASGSLKKVLIEAMKYVVHPKDEVKSYFDYWIEKQDRSSNFEVKFLNRQLLINLSK